VNREQVIDAVRDIMTGARCYEMERLERIHDALKPWTPQARHHTSCRHVRMSRTHKLKWRSQTNFLPLVLDVFSQSMKVDNYLASDTKETASPWKWWQRNKFDARQTGIIRSALQYGAAYTTVLPSLDPVNGQSGAFLRGLSPRQMTCLYGEPVEWVPGQTPVDDDWPILALEVKDKAVRLYDEENVYFVGIQNVPESALGWKDPMYQVADNYKYLEARPHNVGVCPVVRYRDRWLLNGEEQYGIIEPLINIQSRIDHTTYEMLVSQYFTAFTQRWVAGWRPSNDEEALAAVAGDVWYFSKSDVKVGQFQAGDIKGYLDSKQSAIRDLAAIGQIPAQNLGVDALVNISEATLAGLETGKDRKSSEIQTCLGESFEQMLRSCAHITGDQKAAQDFESEVKWQETTARSLAETVDALVKMRQGLDVPEEILWEDIPQWTNAKVERAKQLQKREQEQMDAVMPQTAQPVTEGSRGGLASEPARARTQRCQSSTAGMAVAGGARQADLARSSRGCGSCSSCAAFLSLRGSATTWSPTCGGRCSTPASRTYTAAARYLHGQGVLHRCPQSEPMSRTPSTHSSRTPSAVWWSLETRYRRRTAPHPLLLTKPAKAVSRAASRHAQQPARETVQETADEAGEEVGWARMLTGARSCALLRDARIPRTHLPVRQNRPLPRRWIGRYLPRRM
jgi:hypothetical protein